MLIGFTSRRCIQSYYLPKVVTFAACEVGATLVLGEVDATFGARVVVCANTVVGFCVVGAAVGALFSGVSAGVSIAPAPLEASLEVAESGLAAALFSVELAVSK